MVKNNKLIERKQFLMRSIYNKNCENVIAAKAEIKQLDESIKINTKELLLKAAERLKSDTINIKKTIPTDGNMKRAVAQVIISILEEEMSVADLKGVFRQGYKIMRTKN